MGAPAAASSLRPAVFPGAPPPLARRHELDRLRTMVVAAVFLFHTVRFFDPLDWHVKNATLHPALIPPMMFFAAWAMPLLFVVSGASAFLALGRRGPGRLARDRLQRLAVPLAVGVFTHVMWQVYLERLAHGEFHGSFLAFVPRYFDGLYGQGGNFAWMGLHLWYLELLLLFSLGLLPLLAWLQRGVGRSLLAWLGERLARGGGAYLLALPVLLVLVVPGPGRLWSDRIFGGWNLLAHACFFLNGFLLAASDRLYERVRRLRWASLAGALVLGAAVGAGFPRSGVLVHGTLGAAALLSGFAVVGWAAVLAFLGFAIEGRREPATPFLARASEATLPIYVLHQPVILGLGYLIVREPLPDPAKWALIAAGSAAACLTLYAALIRRFALLRFLFGMASRPRARSLGGPGSS